MAKTAKPLSSTATPAVEPVTDDADAPAFTVSARIFDPAASLSDALAALGESYADLGRISAGLHVHLKEADAATAGHLSRLRLLCHEFRSAIENHVLVDDIIRKPTP